MGSVTGVVYDSRPLENNDNTATTSPISVRVTLFTKEGCTLCDKVKEVLMSLSQRDYPHSLHQMDITDPEHIEWYDRYRYDIPVLHINDQYWTKHRLSLQEAKEALTEAIHNRGKIQPRTGQPNAAAMEHKPKSSSSNNNFIITSNNSYQSEDEKERTQ